MATHQEYVDTLNPVVLELGTALFTCQIFECSLCLLVSMLKSENEKNTNFDAIYDFHSKKVTGNLIERLKKVSAISEEDQKTLDLGLKKRNEIVHGFLTSRLTTAIDTSAQITVISELRDFRDKIRKADSVVNRKISELTQKYGISLEYYKLAADEYFDLLRTNSSLLKN